MTRFILAAFLILSATGIARSADWTPSQVEAAIRSDPIASSRAAMGDYAGAAERINYLREYHRSPEGKRHSFLTYDVPQGSAGYRGVYGGESPTPTGRWDPPDTPPITAVDLRRDDRFRNSPQPGVWYGPRDFFAPVFP